MDDILKLSGLDEDIMMDGDFDSKHINIVVCSVVIVLASIVTLLVFVLK